jgi:hypothetical protein
VVLVLKKSGRARLFIPAFFEEKSKKSFPSILFADSSIKTVLICKKEMNEINFLKL